MFDTVEKLDKALKEAHDRCVYELNKIDDYNVDKIYHYTNLAAGIKF